MELLEPGWGGHGAGEIFAEGANLGDYGVTRDYDWRLGDFERAL